MIQALLDVAPAATWLRLGASGVLLLVGFTALSHALLHSSAYGAAWRGATAQQGLERMVRLGLAALLAGFAVWGWDLAWPAWLTFLLAGAAVVALALEATALARR